MKLHLVLATQTELFRQEPPNPSVRFEYLENFEFQGDQSTTMDMVHPQVTSIATPDLTVNSLPGKINALEKKFEKFFTDRRGNETLVSSSF